MAWLSRNNIAPTDSLTADMLNSLANDIRYWGGDVNGGGYKLSNVVMSGTGGFERIPSPAIIAPVIAGGLAQIQLVDYVAGTPDVYPPRWTITKKALPTPDYGIARYSAAGTLLDEPFMIRAVDGVIVMKAQEWTGPVNGGGQTITNVVLGPSVIAGAQTPWKQDINAAGFKLDSLGATTLLSTSAVSWLTAAKARWALHLSGVPEDFYISRYNDAGSYLDSPLYIVRATGQVVIGNLSVTNVSAATKGAIQTPWLQDIDAAQWGLFRVGTIRLTGPPHIEAGATGIGLEIFADGTIGQVQSYNRTAGSNDYAPLHLTGKSVNIVHGTTLIASTQVDGLSVTNLKQAGDSAHAWNAEISTGSWRYVANGYAEVITGSIGDGNFRFYTSPSGTAGSPVSFVATAAFGPTQINLTALQVNQKEVTAGGSATYVFQSSAAQSRWQVGLGGSPGNYVISRFNDAGAYIDNPLSIDRATGHTGFNNHEINTLAKLRMNNTVDLSIVLFYSDATNTYGLGVEPSTQFYQVPPVSYYRWYFGVNDGAGPNMKMQLSASKLTINVPTDMKGNLDMGGFTISNIGGAGAGFVTTFNTRTGAVVSVLGDYPPAKLGTGTPDNTKYLRGDGTWQVPPGSAGGEPQTPWTRNIEGAGYSLLNAGMGDFAATTVAADQPGIVIRQPLRQAGLPTGQTDIASMPRLMFHWIGVAYAQIGMVADGTIRTFNGPGTGYAPFYAGFGEFAAYSPGLGYGGTTGLIIREAARASLITPEYAPRITFWWGGLGATQIGSDPLSYLGIRTYNSDGTDFAYFSSGSMRFQDNIAMNVDISGKCTRNAQPALLIQADNVNGGQVYFGFAANGTKGAAVSYHSFPINITTANFLLGAPQIPKVTISSRWLYAAQLHTNINYVHAWNVDDTSGAWRYVANGTGFHMYLGSDDWFHFKISPSGVAGAVPGSWTDAMGIHTSTVIFNVPVTLNAGGRAAVLQGINELDIDFYITNAGTNVKRSRLMAYSSGYIALNTLDDAYTMITSRLELYNNKVLSSHPICVTGGGLYAPGQNGLHLGYDGANCIVAGHNGTAFVPLYLRGQHVYMEAQGGSLLLNGLVSVHNHPIVEIPPQSQSDPGGFGSLAGAHYTYFDPATKKLVLRYHEGGVAFRNYILKEGDQGSTLVVVDRPAADATSGSNITAGNGLNLTNSFAKPTGNTVTRIRFTLQATVGGSNQANITIGTSGTAATKGQVTVGAFPNAVYLGAAVGSGTYEVDVTIAYSTFSAKYIANGRSRKDGGAWAALAFNAGINACGGDLSAANILIQAYNQSQVIGSISTTMTNLLVENYY